MIFSAVSFGVFASVPGNRALLKFAAETLKNKKNNKPMSEEDREKALKIITEIEKTTGLDMKKISMNGKFNAEEFLWQIEDKLPTETRDKLRRLRKAKARDYGDVASQDEGLSGGDKAPRVGADGVRRLESEKFGEDPNSRLDDGRRYVQIDGKYYLYRKDNMYTLANGEKVYFVDNANARRLASEDEHAKKPVLQQQGFYNTQALDNVKDAPPAIQQQLQELQKGLDKRNEALEELVGDKSDK